MPFKLKSGTEQLHFSIKTKKRKNCYQFSSVALILTLILTAVAESMVQCHDEEGNHKTIPGPPTLTAASPGWLSWL